MHVRRGVVILNTHFSEIPIQAFLYYRLSMAVTNDLSASTLRAQATTVLEGPWPYSDSYSSITRRLVILTLRYYTLHVRIFGTNYLGRYLGRLIHSLYDVSPVIFPFHKMREVGKRKRLIESRRVDGSKQVSSNGTLGKWPDRRTSLGTYLGKV